MRQNEHKRVWHRRSAHIYIYWMCICIRCTHRWVVPFTSNGIDNNNSSTFRILTIPICYWISIWAHFSDNWDGTHAHSFISLWGTNRSLVHIYLRENIWYDVIFGVILKLAAPPFTHMEFEIWFNVHWKMRCDKSKSQFECDSDKRFLFAPLFSFCFLFYPPDGYDGCSN